MDDLGSVVIPSSDPRATSTVRSGKTISKVSPDILIQRQISGENIKLTSDQITSFLSSKPTAKFRAILDSAITRRIIDPDVALLSLIRSFRSRENIYPIAIALRLGANPNMYIYDPESGVVGTMHILGYLYYNGRKNGIEKELYFNTVVLLLIHYGSSPMRAIYDNSGGGIKESIQEAKMGRNVMDWLTFNDYHHILESAFPDYRRNITEGTKNILAILTGDRCLISIPFIETDIEKIIMARNTRGEGSKVGESKIGAYGHYNLLPDCPDPKMKDSINLDWMVLIWAMDNYDDDTTSYYTSMGLIYSYPLMAKLLIRMKKNESQGNIYLNSTLSRILELNVGSGYIMDTEQMEYLGTISSVLRDRVKSIYAQPYWTKVCSFNPSPSLSIDSTVPKKLQATAITLGIENPSSHQNVCMQLRRMTESDKNDLKTAARNRQLSRLGAKHGYISDFTAGSCPPVLYCVNRSTIDGEYSDYSDMSLSSYRDSNGDVWCFLSPNYKYMLETGKNPISGSMLPEPYLEEIKTKLDMLRDLGVDERKPSQLSQAIDELMKPDEPDNDVTDSMLNRLYKLSSGYISQERIKNATQEQLMTILSASGYTIDLSNLTKQYSLCIFAYIIDHYGKTSDSRLRVVMERLRQI